jgi:hypothetical protein
MKDLVDKSMGIVTHIAETLSRIKPIETIRLDKREVHKKRNCSDSSGNFLYFIYYEASKRKIETKYIRGCRCYERLQSKTKKFTRLSYTELVLEMEHLKIETRLITEMFANVMGECEN